MLWVLCTVRGIEAIKDNLDTNVLRECTAKRNYYYSVHFDCFDLKLW